VRWASRSLLVEVWGSLPADEPHPPRARRRYVRFEALGPVFAIDVEFPSAGVPLCARRPGSRAMPGSEACAQYVRVSPRDRKRVGTRDSRTAFRAVFLSNAAEAIVIAEARVRAVGRHWEVTARGVRWRSKRWRHLE